MRHELSLKLCFIHLNHGCNLFLLANDKAISKHQKIRNKKLKNLKRNNLEKSGHDPNRVIYNFSNYQLTESEKSVQGSPVCFST